MNNNTCIKDLSEVQRKKLAKLFQAFSDETRLKILWLLFKEKQSVKKIIENTNMEQSAISHQLAYLKKINIVESKREGKFIYYSLKDEHIKTIILMGKEHIEE